MKKFAKLSSNNKVIRVHVIEDAVAPSEQAGIDYLKKLHDYPFWVQTFKGGSQRKNSAIQDATYDKDKDAFIHPQPYTSWVLNESTYRWEAPVAMPDDGQRYDWKEETISWDLVKRTPLS